MQKRVLLAPLGAVVAISAVLFVASVVLDQPLETVNTNNPHSYAANRKLSEPAIAGMLTFGATCAECHGGLAEGTDRGPSLLERDYAKDFRDSDQFHRTVGRAIPAHRDVPGAGPDGRLSFNMLEKMSKFLRETRRVLNQPEIP